MFSQRFLFLVTLFTLALGVLPSPLQERATSKCTARDIAIVRRTVSDEGYFCEWWLSDIRTRSPFLEFTHSQVTDLCKCISSSSTVFKSKREERSVEDVLEKRQSQASCTAEMSKQFTEPWHFCAFYNAYPRTTSPFALYSAKQLLTLCKCVVTKQASSVPFCSSQSTLLASKPTLLSQASQYCSSLLRPTLSAVKTITKATTITETKTQGNSIVNFVSIIKGTSTVNGISTEKVIQSITAKSTTTETSVIVQYTKTTNIGSVSVAVDTETSVQIINVAASTEADSPTTDTTVYVRRDASASLAVPSVWKTLAPAQVTQACNCIVKSGSLKPTTVYTSVKTIMSTATSFATKQAQSSRVVSVTRISTVNKLSTIRSTLTSIISTAVQTQTIKSTSKAILTISKDSVSTSIDQAFTVVTYTCPSVAAVTPTATAWSTSWSTITITAAKTLPTNVYTFTVEFPGTESFIDTSTATTCTYANPSKRQAQVLEAIAKERTVYSTVSVCPPPSTLTSTITSTTSGLTTTTATETKYTTSMHTETEEPINPLVVETTVTVTPACTPSPSPSPSTVYLVTVTMPGGFEE
ncbi:hypothetical protein KCU65_g4482, partial [Aureobasidium melanogenum]